MSIKIISISVNTTPKRYIGSLIRRFDGTYNSELTDDANRAKDFLTVKIANEIKGKLFNPYERVFSVEQLSVTETMPAEIEELESKMK